ncbi:Bax inhibitor-1/YccA family protein [Acholeplasma sp. OttesenSCG-928-E16]|nr:Bax inhibitor-1/YccA family protein [Acholeplasma sp. OttesenSCG-928-E16]
MALNSTNPVFKRVESEVDAHYVEGQEVKTATFNGVLIKTGILFLVALAAGALFVFLANQLIMQSEVNGSFLAVVVATVIVSPLIAFVSCLIGTFSVKAAPTCAIIYSIFEGVFLGTLCALLEMVYSGIFLVAMTSLFMIFGITLLMYSIKAVRVTKKFYRFMLISLFGILGVSLTTFLISFIPGLDVFDANSGLIWVLIIVDAFMVFYGAMMLIMDFDRASNIQEMNAPKKYEWQVSLGMMLTIVWLLVYILRILVRILAVVGRKK